MNSLVPRGTNAAARPPATRPMSRLTSEGRKERAALARFTDDEREHVLRLADTERVTHRELKKADCTERLISEGGQIYYQASKNRDHVVAREGESLTSQEFDEYTQLAHAEIAKVVTNGLNNIRHCG